MEEGPVSVGKPQSGCGTVGSGEKSSVVENRGPIVYAHVDTDGTNVGPVVGLFVICILGMFGFF